MKWKTRVELTAGGKRLTEVKIQREIFQVDVISLLLFIIAMIPLNPILKKCTGGYKLHKLQENIYNLMYIDIKLSTKKNLEILIQAVGIYSLDIKCVMLIMRSGKQHMLGEKETYKYLGILEAENLKHANNTSEEREIKLRSRNLINNWDERRTSTNGQRARKPMMIHKALHPRDDVDRLNV